MQRLSGIWAGTYEFVEPEVKGPHRIGFTLEIISESLWRFRGEVQDDPATGMAGRGTISGWSLGRHVWFRKVMPELQVTHDPKPLALEGYVEAHFGERLVGDPGRHIVSYRGVVAGNQQRITGTWRIPHRRVVLESGRVILFPFARGNWEMHRQ